MDDLIGFAMACFGFLLVLAILAGILDAVLTHAPGLLELL